MSDTVTPETGTEPAATPQEPFRSRYDVADSLAGVLSPEDYPSGDTEEPAQETEETEEATEEQTEADESQEATEETSEETEETEDADSAEEVEEPEPKLYRVNVDGEEQRVTFDELKRGYSREADYTRKTQALAEEKKQISEMRQRYESQLDQAIPALQAAIQGEFAEIDWPSLAQEDPAEYTALKARYDQRMTSLNQALAEKQMLQKEREEEQKKQFQEAQTKGRQKLVEIHPVFGDPQKGPEVAGKVVKFLRGQGFSDEDIGSVTDHRALSMAYKAMLYDEAQSKVKKAKTASKAAPKVQKPGTPQKTDSVEEGYNAAKRKVRDTRSLADALAYTDIGHL